MAPLDPLIQERVYHALKADYLAGRFVPGRRLDVQELANRYRSSKTPVREAACILVGEGLLSHHPDGGFTVPLDDPGTVIDLQHWHMQLILTVISGLKDSALRRTLVEISMSARQRSAVDLALRTMEIFVALAAATSNRRSIADVRRLNERLHYVRIVEGPNTVAAEKELMTLTNINVANVQKNVRRRIEAYHVRRIAQLSATG